MNWKEKLIKRLGGYTENEMQFSKQMGTEQLLPLVERKLYPVPIHSAGSRKSSGIGEWDDILTRARIRDDIGKQLEPYIIYHNQEVKHMGLTLVEGTLWVLQHESEVKA